MFHGAHEIQEWLKECARRISKSLGPKDYLDKKQPTKSMQYLSTVVWTTPLGLPVCQPYRKVDLRAIQTLMTNIYLTNPNAMGPVNGRKQATAFPPNFIHSLDASHMLMSAIACDQVGLTFSSVHDSFWTHACDVDTMNVVLREAFVRMHQGDLIKKLRDEFIERYKGHYYLVEDGENCEADASCNDEETSSESSRKRNRVWKPIEFPPVPKKVTIQLKPNANRQGEFKVNRLKESVYFFS